MESGVIARNVVFARPVGKVGRSEMDLKSLSFCQYSILFI